jgi:hypothetical protein
MEFAWPRHASETSEIAIVVAKGSRKEVTTTEEIDRE